MNQYIFTMALSLLLAWFMEHTRAGIPGSSSDKTYKRILIFAIYVALVLFVGLRTSYNDTAAYKASYENAQLLPDFFTSSGMDLGDYPAFRFFSSALRTFGVTTQGFLLISSALILALMLFFLRKYSFSFLMTLFLFLMTNAYSNTAAALKQSFAVAIGLLAIPFALNKKWFRFVLIILFGSLFHPYLLMYLIIPLLTFRPWSKWTYVLIIVFVCAGFMLESLFGTILDITTLIGKEYTEDKLMGEGINIFRILVANVPLILSFVYRMYIGPNSTKAENLIINLAMINGAIMFVGHFGSSIAFSRLASYFTIFQCVALPLIISKIPHKDRKPLTVVMVVCYMGFFAYANKGFDNDFSRITLWQYIKSLT